jgi:putative transposase
VGSQPRSTRRVHGAVIAAGTSTREYASTLDLLPEGVNEAGVSKSAVSRRFVALTTRQLGEFVSRSLGELDLRVVYIDGKVFKEHCILFIIDGAKALRRAVRDAFGDYGVVQRCQLHKRKNVLGHFPESMHASVDRAMKDAYRANSEKLAQKQLLRLAKSLEQDHPSAAGSIREGLDETLTVIRLGANGALLRTLCTTNPIENLNGSIEHYTRDVQRWQEGRMIELWVAAALIHAEKRFHRIRGYRDLPSLIAALDADVGVVVHEDVQVA